MIKEILGREWKFLLLFIGIALFNLIFDYWLINILGFCADLMLIGYIISSTNNEIVLSTLNIFKK